MIIHLLINAHTQKDPNKMHVVNKIMISLT